MSRTRDKLGWVISSQGATVREYDLIKGVYLCWLSDKVVIYWSFGEIPKQSQCKSQFLNSEHFLA